MPGSTIHRGRKAKRVSSSTKPSSTDDIDKIDFYQTIGTKVRGILIILQKRPPIV
jgi:hypothetical protein